MTSAAIGRPTAAQWVAGARPRTLPAAVSPVLAGTGVAVHYDGFSPVRALLCLVVALALQVGVNYANDYSDGIRGTDTVRVGPLRLVGSGLADSARVKAAALACFGIAAMAGLGLTLLTGLWWLPGIGAAAVLAAWYYTGGKRPYGYAGLGEVSVFVFFGLVAVTGTTGVQLGSLPMAAWAAGAAIGALSCAILVVNNLRDLPGDAAVGKRTLATRLGDRRTRVLYVALLAAAAALTVGIAASTTWWALLGLPALGVAGPAVRTVLRGGEGRALIGVLLTTGTAELAYAVALTAGLALGRL